MSTPFTRVICLVALCMACRGGTTAEGAGGISGSAPVGGAGNGGNGTGGSQCGGSGGAYGTTVCSAAECQGAANRHTANGCLVCQGVACEPDDTCAASGHYSGGIKSTHCSCPNGAFFCWGEDPPFGPGSVGGASGNGGSGGGGGHGDASAPAIDASLSDAAVDANAKDVGGL